MYWECSEESNCEDGSGFGVADEDFRLQDIITGLESGSQARRSRWRWYKLIQEYTSRSMTYSSDKLPALSGIAAAIQIQTRDTYCAGIWRKTFLADLLWRLEDPDFDMCVYGPKYPKKPDVWRAPSWSWASVEGVVRYQDIIDLGESCAELEQCSLTPSGANLLGGLRAGFAQIRAPVTTIQNIALERTSEGYICDLQLKGPQLKKAKLFLDFERRDSCLALMLTPHSGLAIIEADGAQQAYVRIGVVQIWRMYNEPWMEASQYPKARSIQLL